MKYNFVIKITKDIVYFILRYINVTIPKKCSIRSKHNSIHTKSFNIPIIAGYGLANIKNHEPWLDDILEKLILFPLDNNREYSFFDIGANIGQTLLKVKAISEKIHYIGFEPNPACIYYINNLIAANPSTISSNNTSIVPIGLSSESAILPLFFNNDSMGSGASIYKEKDNRKLVPLMPLESLNATLEYPDIKIIKIDIELAELDAFEALQNTISVYEPFILIEVLPVYSEKNLFRIRSQNKLLKLIKELNYKMFRIIKCKKNKLSYLQSIEDFGIHDDLRLCDYILCPSSRLSQFCTEFSVDLDQ